MVAIINIYLKSGVLDSQGKAVHHALDSLGFGGVVEDVRIGRQVILKLKTDDKDKALEEARKMADQLLANTVIEDYKIELLS